MAISETSLKDVALMTIEEINEKGGVLGRKLEPVVVDPASNWPLFAEKARDLIQNQKVAVTFGCWTSVSRKSVLPVFEELNGLLFYPVQYEGEESSWNVFYTGAAPNQQAIPAVEYLMSKKGGNAKRWVLLGTDYVYPRTTNKILRYFLHSKGVADDDIMEKYTPFGHSDYQTIVADVKKFATGKRTAVVSTINGDSNVPFYKELGNQGIKATDIPVVAFSVGEEELRGIDTKPLVGQLAAWNYFESMDTPENKAFIDKWMAYVKKNNLPGGDKRVTNDPMEATYIGIHMWAQAVEQAQSTNVDAVRQAVGYQHFKAPSGFDITHGRQEPPPAQAGRHRRGQGRRSVPRGVEDRRPDPAQAWSPFIPDSAKKVADWTYPWACGNCTAPKFGAAGVVRGQVTNTQPNRTDVGDSTGSTARRWCAAPAAALRPGAHAVGRLAPARWRMPSTGWRSLRATKIDRGEHRASWRRSMTRGRIRRWTRSATIACGSAPTAIRTSGIRRPATCADPLTGAVVAPAPRPLKEVEVGNEIRRVALPVLAQLQLGSPDAAVRLAAAEELSKSGSAEARRRCCTSALDREKDSEVREALALAVRARRSCRARIRQARIAALRADRQEPATTTSSPSCNG